MIGVNVLVKGTTNGTITDFDGKFSIPPASESSGTAATEATKRLYRETVRSEVPAGAAVFRDVLSQVLMLLILAAFPYGILWGQGDRDRNSVQFGHMQEDKRRGLKVGLLAAIPSVAVYLFLLLSRLGLFWDKYIQLFQILNASFAPAVNAVMGAQGHAILVTCLLYTSPVRRKICTASLTFWRLTSLGSILPVCAMRRPPFRSLS